MKKLLLKFKKASFLKKSLIILTPLALVISLTCFFPSSHQSSKKEEEGKKTRGLASDEGLPFLYVMEQKDISPSGQKRFLYKIIARNLSEKRSQKKDQILGLLKQMSFHPLEAEKVLWVYSDEKFLSGLPNLEEFVLINNALSHVSYTTLLNSSYSPPQNCKEALKSWSSCYKTNLCNICSSDVESCISYGSDDEVSIQDVLGSDLDFEVDFMCQENSNLYGECASQISEIHEILPLLEKSQSKFFDSLSCSN